MSFRNQDKSPLSRKVNTCTRGVWHGGGQESRFERSKEKQSDRKHGSTHGQKRNGLDHTPLFRFLLSKVGQDWNAVFSEAIARIDREEPIFWLVARDESERRAIVNAGETSYYNGLFVDEEGKLRIIDPMVTVETLKPDFGCCTR